MESLSETKLILMYIFCKAKILSLDGDLGLCMLSALPSLPFHFHTALPEGEQNNNPYLQFSFKAVSEISCLQIKKF